MLRDTALSEKLRSALMERLDELKQKQEEACRVGGPEYTSSLLLRGRIQGAIGEIERILREG